MNVLRWFLSFLHEKCNFNYCVSTVQHTQIRYRMLLKIIRRISEKKNESFVKPSQMMTCVPSPHVSEYSEQNTRKGTDKIFPMIICRVSDANPSIYEQLAYIS